MVSAVSNINMLSQKKIIEEYTLPDANLIKNKRIILYGAGKVGQAYYKQIINNQICEVVLWVDKNPKGENVSEVSKILKTKYDVIIIAVLEKMLFEHIKNELCEQGIDEGKIIWQVPKILVDV